MSQKKKFCTGALLLLLCWLGGQVLGEISDDFSHCLDFFYNKTPPKGIDAAGYQPICQRYKNQYHFASLYHRQSRAPMYSAYRLGLADGKRPNNTWKYEPQLVFSRASSEMTPFKFATYLDQNVIESQAMSNDYRDSNFTRGHLNPSMHQKTKENRQATFTLTNVVPQRAGSNGGSWNGLENEVLKRFKTYCNGSMHVITGVLPYESEPLRINNRVSVPEYMWSAYCCPSNRSDLPAHMQSFFPTHAAVGRNDPNSGEEIVPINVKAKASKRGYDVRRMSLETLEGILAQRLAMSVSLFQGQCQ
ncbi:endonuclease domain-containing 1 protein-like [Notothenia coriiceps]|uniref:Endonuclease domain-containing 1 protein-like n=1 Tax=Notothenia coriiceps TaxID=8208 RepID=A0A6I9PAF4_9TELE|nr:PREDICTED: endonuclease domain-containing 1 protein-like [Notothenia coriiceps]